MKVANEFDGIGKGFGKIGEGVSSIFDADHRAAREEIAKAQRAAAKEISQAQAEAAKAALKASTAETISKIQAGAAQAALATTASAPAKAPGFFARKAQSVGSRMQSAFKSSMWLIEQPFALVLKPVKWVANGLGNAFVKAPVKSTAAAGVVALVAGGTWLANRSSKAMQNELESQAMAAQAMAAEPSVSYKNSVSADEAALLEGRMSAGKAHADAVTAARQQVPTPENAAGL